MPIELPSHSRFKLSDKIIFNGVETIGLMKKFDFLDLNKLKKNDISEFVVDGNTAGRPDKIANIVYGNPELCWILMFVNKPVNILRWPKNGDIIIFPNRSIVLPEL